MNENLEMARIAYQALSDKKGDRITVLDISEISVIADYFVIATGANDNQIQTLTENVEEKMSRAGYLPKLREGIESKSWILLDYGDVIVHIFDRESREFYDLDRIWSDGKTVTF